MSCSTGVSDRAGFGNGRKVLGAPGDIAGDLGPQPSGLSSFYAIAEALLAIKDGKLYKDTHRSFDTYCRERRDFGRDSADRRIAWLKVVKTLPANTPAPSVRETTGNAARARQNKASSQSPSAPPTVIDARAIEVPNVTTAPSGDGLDLTEGLAGAVSYLPKDARVKGSVSHQTAGEDDYLFVRSDTRCRVPSVHVHGRVSAWLGRSCSGPHRMDGPRG